MLVNVKICENQNPRPIKKEVRVCESVSPHGLLWEIQGTFTFHRRGNVLFHPDSTLCLFPWYVRHASPLGGARMSLYSFKWKMRRARPQMQKRASSYYTPVDPKQLFHVHCSVCVHVCGYTVILAPDAGNV